MIARIRFLCNEIDKVEPLKPKGQKMFERGSTNLGWLLSEDDVVWSVAGRDNVAVIEERSASMEQEKWTGGFTVSSRGR
jgi:hypothetical protein